MSWTMIERRTVAQAEYRSVPQLLCRHHPAPIIGRRHTPTILRASDSMALQLVKGPEDGISLTCWARVS
jgi:hypothetical protein